MNKTGLVLSGGGAKGAYQIGVMRALNEMGIQIDMIAGASIGALNGAVLASAPNMQVGTERLEELWETLAQSSPLSVDKKNILGSAMSFTQYLPLLLAFASRLHPAAAGGLMGLTQLIKHSDLEKYLPILAKISNSNNSATGGIFSNDELQNKMDKFLDLEHLKNSIPLYVSIFKSDGVFMDLLQVGMAQFLGKENKSSEFVHIQSYSPEKQKKYLMASAAIPILFAAQLDENQQKMVDGGIGGWRKAQGNTPIQPLIDAGCNHVIVTHLSHGSLWNRNDYPNTTIYEIRPNHNLDMSLSKTLSFSKERLDLLVQGGYDDTREQIGKVHEFMRVYHEKQNIQNQLAKSMNKQDESNKKMDDFMDMFKQNT